MQVDTLGTLCLFSGATSTSQIIKGQAICHKKIAFMRHSFAVKAQQLCAFEVVHPVISPSLVICTKKTKEKSMHVIGVHDELCEENEGKQGRTDSSFGQKRHFRMVSTPV